MLLKLVLPQMSFSCFLFLILKLPESLSLQIYQSLLTGWLWTLIAFSFSSLSLFSSQIVCVFPDLRPEFRVAEPYAGLWHTISLALFFAAFFGALADQKSGHERFGYPILFRLQSHRYRTLTCCEYYPEAQYQSYCTFVSSILVVCTVRKARQVGNRTITAILAPTIRKHCIEAYRKSVISNIYNLAGSPIHYPPLCMLHFTISYLLK